MRENCEKSSAWWINHGPDIMRERNEVQAQVERLTQELAGMRTSYKAALREIDRLHNQPDEVKP